MCASFLPPDQLQSSVEPEPRSSLICKNVVIQGRRTSVRLDPVMWDGLAEICQRQAASLHTICSAIAEHKAPHMSMSTAIRVFIVSYFREAATEEGHQKSGHFCVPEANILQKLVQDTMA